ncbi:hypothetical protein [Parasphingorhabdus sp.]|uniref:hypothetical protein n=1 Tax=Parasphingorhabdus sp. TaxID=2709688 RepID=UPI0035932394
MDDDEVTKNPFYKGDNAGGYGNPPVNGQFKKDGPGGPGRPTGTTNLECAIRKAIKKKRPVKRDGKTVKMASVDVFAEQVLQAVLSRSKTSSMLQFGLWIFEKYGPDGLVGKASENAPPDLSQLTDVELQLYGYLCCRVEGKELDTPLSPRVLRILEQVGKIVEAESQRRR